MEQPTVKEKAKQLVNELPDNASWDDLMYKIYVLQSIEAGLRDSNENRVFTVNEVRKRFGLQE